MLNVENVQVCGGMQQFPHENLKGFTFLEGWHPSQYGQTPISFFLKN